MLCTVLPPDFCTRPPAAAAARHRGDLARVYLQEAVSYEAGYKPTMHTKYGSGSAACGGALGAGGKAAEGVGADLAYFKVRRVLRLSAAALILWPGTGSWRLEE